MAAADPGTGPFVVNGTIVNWSDIDKAIDGKTGKHDGDEMAVYLTKVGATGYTAAGPLAAVVGWVQTHPFESLALGVLSALVLTRGGR